jgi:hypothetical protein
MSRLRRIYTLLQTAALSALTVTATTGTATDAQAQTSPSATAYAAALDQKARQRLWLHFSTIFLARRKRMKRFACSS